MEDSIPGGSYRKLTQSKPVYTSLSETPSTTRVFVRVSLQRVPSFTGDIPFFFLGFPEHTANNRATGQNIEKGEATNFS
jgi:hypothetical protein